MQCPNCGADSQDNKICEYCGTNLAPHQSAPVPPPSAASSYAAPPPLYPPPVQPARPLIQPRSQQHRVVKVIILVVAIFVAFNVVISCMSAIFSNSVQNSIVQNDPNITFEDNFPNFDFDFDENSDPVSEEPTDQPPAPGTRRNPLPLKTTATFDGTGSFVYKFKLDLTATEVVRGAAAREKVKAANQFNADPSEGMEYILVKFKVKAHESQSDEKINLNNIMFDFISKDGVAYNSFVSIAGLKPSFSSLYPGGEMEGYAYSIIKKGDTPSIVFLESVNKGLWFAVQ